MNIKISVYNLGRIIQNINKQSGRQLRPRVGDDIGGTESVSDIYKVDECKNVNLASWRSGKGNTDAINSSVFSKKSKKYIYLTSYHKQSGL